MRIHRAIASAGVLPGVGKDRWIVRRIQLLLAHEGPWSVAAQALASGMSFLVSIFAARALGVEEFGGFVLILTGIFIFGALQHQLVASPMMTAAGLRRRPAAYYAVIGRLLLLASLLSGLAVAAYVLALYGWHAARPRYDLVLAGSVAGFGFVLHDGLKRILFVTRRPRLALLLEALRYAIFAAAALVTWLTVGIDTARLLLCLGLAPIAATVPFLPPLLRGRVPRRLNASVIARHWHTGRWMALMVLVSTSHEHVVTVAAGTMLGEWAAAGLRAAQILFGPVLVLLMSLENFVPRSAGEALQAGGRPALAAYLLRVFLIGVVPLGAFCAAVALLNDTLLRLLLGPPFTAFDHLVTIVAVVPALIFARELGITYLRTLGQTRGVFLAFALSAAFVVVALIPLVQAFGVTGAAFAFVAGHLLSTIFIVGAAWRA